MGTVILMLIMGYGSVWMWKTCALRCSTATRPSVPGVDTQPLRFPLLYRTAAAPSYDELDRRMRAGDITVAIESRPISGAISRVVRLWNSASGRRSDAQSCRNGKRLRAGNAQSWLQDVASRQSTPASQSGL